MVDSKTTFSNRKDAGKQLGTLLNEKMPHQNILVLGLSCGGVEVADEVAKSLHAELSFIIAKKVRTQKEFTVGAISEEGQVFLPAFNTSSTYQPELQKLIENETYEIEDSVKRFRKGKPLPDMTDRTIILIDDGICSNTTFVPAINLCRKRNAAKVIVASPVGGMVYVNKLSTIADETIVLKQPEDFYAIGQVYDSFCHLKDHEITRMLGSHKSTSRKITRQMVA